MTAELRFEHDTVELQGEKISQHLEAPTSQVCPHLLVSGGGLRHEKKGKEIPNLSCSRKSQRSKLEGGGCDAARSVTVGSAAVTVSAQVI